MNVTLKKLQWLVCISGFLDIFGVALIYPLLVHRVKELGASPSQVGLFGSIYGTLQFITSPLMGQFSDHVGRRNVLIIALIGTSISYALLGTAESILFLSLARIPSGIFKHSQAMSRAYLADIIPSNERAGVFGRFNAISSIGFVIGPTLAGSIAMNKNGFSIVAFLSSLIFIINALFNVFFIPYLLGVQPPSKHNDKKDNEKKEFSFFSSLNVFRDAHKIPWHLVWDAFLIRFFMSFSLIIYRSNFTSILAYKYETNQLTNGYIQTFNGIVSMVTGWCIGGITSHFSTNAVMHNVFAVILVLSLIALTIAPTLSLYVAAIVPLCVASAILRVANATAITNRGGEEARGLILGLADTLTALGRAFAPVIAGYAMEIGYMVPGFCAAFFAALGTLIGFYMSFNLREVKQHSE